MKFIQMLTFAVILVAMLVARLCIKGPENSALTPVLTAYVLMLGISGLVNYKKTTAASHIALFVAAVAVCYISVSAYYQYTFSTHTGRGFSTAGLIFFIMPVFSIPMFLLFYVVAQALIALIYKKDQESLLSRNMLIVGFILLTVFEAYLVHYSSRFTRIRPYAGASENREFSNGDVVMARKSGLFAKGLHYQVDSFNGLINFYPYIEKGFKYGSSSADIKSLEDTDYPYTLSFQRNAVKGAVIVIRKGLRYDLRYDGRYLLKKPDLDDTVCLDIKRSGVVLGSIKIWN